MDDKKLYKIIIVLWIICALVSTTEASAFQCKNLFAVKSENVLTQNLLDPVHSEVAKRINQIENRVPRDFNSVIEKHNIKEAHSLFKYIFEMRLEIVKDLKLMAFENGISESYQKAIQKTAAELEVHEKELEKLSQYANKNEGVLAFKDGNSYHFKDTKIDAKLRSLLGTTYGPLGELKTAFKVEGFERQGAFVKELLDKEIIEANDNLPGQRSIGDKEIDIVYENGMAWGEVKNYVDTFTRQHNNYEKILERAEELNHFIESLPSPYNQIKLTYFFMGGISPKAKNELESLSKVQVIEE